MAKEEKKAPKLRFNGYTNDWEQVKLGDVAEITPGGTPSKNISDYWYPKEIPWLSSGEINKEIIFSTNDMISKKGFNNSSAKWVNQNSVLIALAGQGKTRGKVAINRIPLTTNQSIAGIDPSDEIYYKFLYHQLTKDYLKLRLISSGDGSRGGLNKKLLNDYAVNLSGIDEQHKIGVLLSHIDNTLQLHERKCEELALIKKALLQKLFPKKDEFKPEVRYKNFSDAWEQRKLGEVATFINGRAYKQNELLDSGKYKVLRVGNFYTNDSWYYSNLELADKYYIDKGDLVYTWSATFGPHIWDGEKVIYHYHIWKIELSESLDRDFTLQILEADKAKLLANTNGSTMIHVTKKDMESKVISLPNIEEQKQIGSYLMKFDSLIALHQRKLEKLKQLKKFLLQNMFI
ncbi:restriction endonuclease subunit S [Ligilactobacillus salivarius]|uniref:restriction endonuclease subunit S n=2 Tax=Ligilactobacillus salivarius TaxID=1624 RepID=UPI00237DAF8A|nr:restriction endonuclease subunit S [Ligilactobacillus salivarius]MDE1522938.1 restriction endonuclease subunit S [Ligilactobacillus salivarius]